MPEEGPIEEMVSVFDLTSPTDYRYEVKEWDKVNKHWIYPLRPFLSETAFIRYKSRVEAALATVLAKRGIISQQVAEEIHGASEQVKALEVYEEEGRTGHDIIAQVNMIRKRLSGEAKTAVHKTATSFDIVESANALRYTDAFNKVIIPDMVSLEKLWIEMARNEKDTIQIGRTHLQHAEPTTFGAAMAWYVSRFGDRILHTKEAANSLEGKFSGAVGAYNASSLFVDDPENFEREVLAELELGPIEISTQITQPEPLTDLIHYVVSTFAVMDNWADDMRNLMRPEIGEVGQPRGKDVSTSSTMPHKANPVGLENIQSLYKATMPFIITMHLDQKSSHQRDLTNSASQRYVPDVLMRFDYAVRRATRVSTNLRTHPHNMARNFAMSADKIVAEPLQLLLSTYGYPDAHKYIGTLVDESVATGKPLLDIVLNNPNLQPYLQRFTPRQMEIVQNPSLYLGIAAQKAEGVANSWEKWLKMRELY